jgi:hypothetical protein
MSSITPPIRQYASSASPSDHIYAQYRIEHGPFFPKACNSIIQLWYYHKISTSLSITCKPRHGIHYSKDLTRQGPSCSSCWLGCVWQERPQFWNSEHACKTGQSVCYTSPFVSGHHLAHGVHAASDCWCQGIDRLR